MIKGFKKFVNESVENPGKGPGTEDNFFGQAPFKQKINQPNQTMDFLRLGKKILTENIDGFIDSVQGDKILITDRMSGVIKTYSMKDFMKEFAKSDKKIKVNESMEEEFDDYDDEDSFDGNNTELLSRVNNGIDDNLRDIEEEEIDDDEEDVLNIPNNARNDNNYNLNPDDKIFNKDATYLSARYGTEDDPEGLRMGKEIWESWNQFDNSESIPYLNEDFNTQDEEDIDEEEDTEEEYESPRGTEDNPLPTNNKNRRRRNIPSELM